MMMDSYEPLARICAFAWMLGLVAVSMMTIQSQPLELELKYIASTVPPCAWTIARTAAFLAEKLVFITPCYPWGVYFPR